MTNYDTEAGFVAFEEARRREAAGFFTKGATISVARAPGRLDVMGGIADYSGSLVAEMPIAQAAFAAAQVGGTEDGAVVVRSLNATAEGLTEEVTLPAELFINPVSLLKRILSGPRSEAWVGYVAGAFAILRAEGLISRRGPGAKILVQSEVPLGAGVSSSAAVEVATMRALTAAFGINLSGLTLAQYAQRVENEIMDAPCGIMDQVTSALGEAGELLLLLCQPYQVQGTVALPPDWTVFGIDSGVKHSVSGKAYTQVRVAAFMGFKMIADRAGSGFGGYLCNVSPDEYRAVLPEGLPEAMTGAVFLANHGGIFDMVTTVDPGQTYPVRAATEHAIQEHVRVNRFIEYLRDGSDTAVREAGRLMRGSHDSYSACGLGSPETDLLVELAEAQSSIAGAKITGGGSGGTVGVLCKADVASRIAQSLLDSYQQRTGNTGRLIQGTSPGAFATPVRTLTL